MKIVEVQDPHRTRSKPDDVAVILESGNLECEGLAVTRIELRLYIQHVDARRGDYSLVTSYVETDKDSVEMTYDEGFRGPKPLESAANLLMNRLGPSALVLRSVMAIRAHTSAAATTATTATTGKSGIGAVRHS